MSELFHRYTLADLSPRPWKNGGGVTRELAGWPVTSSLEDFGWRVSVAEIGASGPFSAFPGIDRIILLLDGQGMSLVSKEADINQLLDTPLTPFHFHGEAPIDSTLVGGISHDFNVMVRRSSYRAEITILHGPGRVPPTPHGLFHAVRGTWMLVPHDSPRSIERLDAGQGLVWHETPMNWQLTSDSPEAALIAVSIQRVDNTHD